MVPKQCRSCRTVAAARALSVAQLALQTRGRYDGVVRVGAGGEAQGGAFCYAAGAVAELPALDAVRPGRTVTPVALRVAGFAVPGAAIPEQPGRADQHAPPVEVERVGVAPVAVIRLWARTTGRGVADIVARKAEPAAGLLVRKCAAERAACNADVRAVSVNDGGVTAAPRAGLRAGAGAGRCALRVALLADSLGEVGRRVDGGGLEVKLRRARRYAPLCGGRGQGW